MRYTHARAGIKDGDVLLFQATGPVSHAIRWATRSRYSHVGLAVWVRDRLMVAESRELRGCRLVPLSSAVQSARIDVYTPAIWCGVERGNVALAALERLGQPYGWARLLRIALGKVPGARWIPGLRHLARGQGWSEDDAAPSGPSMICSQYVAWCYRRGGVDLVPNLSDGDTTPGDIARSAVLELAFPLEP